MAKGLRILTCYFDTVVLTLGKKIEVVFYKAPVKILWPKPVNWIGTYIDTNSKGHCCSLYTPVLQSSSNICSEKVSVFF